MRSFKNLWVISGLMISVFAISVLFQNCSPLKNTNLKSPLSSMGSSNLASIGTNNFQNLNTKAEVNKIVEGMLAEKKESSVAASGAVVSLRQKAAGLGINSELVIQPGENVVIDTNLDVGTLTINGSLFCSNQYTMNYQIKATTIFVNGTFECGSSESDRFSGKLSIILKDSNVNTAARRGLMVNPNGLLKLFGMISKSTWFRLSQTASAGSTVLNIDGDVSGWQPDDSIAVGPTGYNLAEAENIQLDSVSTDGKQIRLRQPLRYNHWGTIQTFQGKSGAVNLDQRAEVANLTRNIKIMPDESNGVITDQNGIGGHVMVMRGGQSLIDSVEFYHMGQAGLVARYPFHWHMAGDVYGQFIRNSSIHHSFQRCITVHGSQRALLQNNVCYDFRGHGYFLEDGDEIDSVLINNLAMYGRRPLADKIILESDRDGSFDPNRAAAMSGFWISHPRNIVRDNVVSGTEGTGFWMSYITGDLENANGRIINKTAIVINGEQIIPKPTLLSNPT